MPRLRGGLETKFQDANSPNKASACFRSGVSKHRIHADFVCHQRGRRKGSEARRREAIQGYAKSAGFVIVDWFYDAAVSGADAIKAAGTTPLNRQAVLRPSARIWMRACGGDHKERASDLSRRCFSRQAVTKRRVYSLTGHDFEIGQIAPLCTWVDFQQLHIRNSGRGW